ncbi:MAG: YqiA/YcfP family alpha/beta fold hydrolase [Halopseudomonas sp.]
MTAPLYLYIHGFNSSPQSYKARQLVQWFGEKGQAERILVPNLPYQPADAVALLEQQLAELASRPLVLLGSSLGGFYATWLTEKLAASQPICSVLINPSIRPFDLLDIWLGENENIYTHERYLLTRDHLQQLKDLDCPQLSDPRRYLLLTQTGDEVLDYRQGVEKYCQSPQVVTPGGEHGFANFESYWPRMFEFAGDSELQRLAKSYVRDNCS